jgi:hypothetical protein
MDTIFAQQTMTRVNPVEKQRVLESLRPALWKGNVPLGHFYNVMVIKCPTHIKWVDYVPNKQEVQIM